MIDSNPKVYIAKEKIAARVKELAQEINRDYDGRPILLIGTLTGSIVFLADLMRELALDVQVDFVKLHSYVGTETSRGIRVELEPDWDVSDRHVIIIEDIVDTGHTAAYLLELFAAKRTASVALCTLLDKPERREVENINCDYIGFTIDNKFVVGYGLDYDQKYRELPYIGVVEL